MTRRSLLAALGGAATLAGLSACALGDDGSKPNTGPVDLNADQSIEVWDYDATGIDLWVKADQDFQSYFSEKYPKVKVNRKTAPFAGFAEALLSSIAGGAKYDVIYGWSPWLPQFVKNNVVSPLDSFLANDGAVNAAATSSSARTAASGRWFRPVPPHPGPVWTPTASSPCRV
jgi:ABC-type glycerol-3-phosphate transport system substrate-binding protein